MSKIIGRQKEQQILRNAMDSGEPEFIAVYGRRRIGKTFLIKQFFNEEFDFYMTGSFNSSRAKHLEYFNMQLERYSKRSWPKPKSWLQAFRQLEDYLSELKRKKRIVVFIDQLPWFDTPKSGFFSALELFWNGWADSRSNLKLIVCGSATTWMTNRLLGDRGGLHNRVNRRIYLAPFSLAETEAMLLSKGIQWTRHQIIECYMTMGGTPFYLNKLDKSLGVAQNIDQLFFHESGELRAEYNILFRSLFNDSEAYRRVVELLAQRSEGMTRAEIINALKIESSGSLSTVIQNLITCDFIREYRSFGKKQRDKLYQLTDLFTLFYLKHVAPNLNEPGNYWASRIDDPTHRAWTGYAFEQVALHHLPQIKAALGIAGLQSAVNAWVGEENGKSVGQIDLVIDRRDQIVNLCEMKFSTGEFEIKPAYIERMLERREAFRRLTKTTKALHLTMVTPYGVKRNAQWQRIQSEVTALDLFRS